MMSTSNRFNCAWCVPPFISLVVVLVGTRRKGATPLIGAGRSKERESGVETAQVANAGTTIREPSITYPSIHPFQPTNQPATNTPLFLPCSHPRLLDTPGCTTHHQLVSRPLFLTVDTAKFFFYCGLQRFKKCGV